MTKEDFKRTSELLTEMRWMVATFTSFIPEQSKERKPFDAKLKELERLRCAHESEAMK
jgi:hypothetical protein